MPTPQIIGERVQAARLAAHLTQQELAGQDYSKSYISAVERGKMTPSFQALRLLAERLGVTIAYLLGEEAPLIVTEAPEAPTVPAEVAEQAPLLHEAERMVQERRFEEALSLLEQIGRPDRTSWAHEQYAQFLADQGRYQEAYEQMRRALQHRR
jgi:transcriptional regulator with XRE-family HTH domain